jgi:AcrR family transcriptional regulator
MNNTSNHSLLNVREKQHAATRDKILKVSWDLLLRNGFENVTMDAIARESGCSRQRVYAYFQGLDEIIYRLQIENMRSSLTAFSSAIQSQDPSPSARLQELVERTFAYQKEHPESSLFTSYFDHYFSHRPSKAAWREEYLSLFHDEAFGREVPWLIKEGIALGEFRSDISIEEASNFWSTMNQSLVERLSICSVNGEDHSEAELDSLRRIYVDALFRYLRK